MSKLGALFAVTVLSVLGAQAAAAPAPLDPSGLVLVPRENLKWSGQPGGVRTAVLYGDPTKEGQLYVQLIQWPATANSRPHSHPHDRWITVLEGTWWVGTGARYNPDTMTPVKTGSFVTHPAGGVHYDGTKGEPALIEVVGFGPATLIPREEK